MARSMACPTRVASVEVADLNIALREPFGIATGAQHAARNLLVTVRLEGGAVGYGEAAPFPAFNGETQEQARAAIVASRSAVEGRDARAWRAIAEAVRVASGGVGSARCGLETAVLDALARHHSMPLWALFGGAELALETDVTVTTGGVAAARAAAARRAAEGFRAIKVKVGGGSLEGDVARVEAIVEAACPDRLLLDGNGGYSADGALELLRALAARGVRPALFEQPVAAGDLEGLGRVWREGGCLVAADESLTGEQAALDIARAGAAGVFNIKLMKCGVAEALGIAAIARAGGVGLMIGGMVESVLAMTTSACFAGGLGGFSFVDLDTPLFMAEEPLEGGFVQRGPHLDIGPIAAGHGVSPRQAG
jgi:L-Ala-D/L-Glu epimerase